jgi:hypothetical protein
MMEILYARESSNGSERVDPSAGWANQLMSYDYLGHNISEKEGMGLNHIQQGVVNGTPTNQSLEILMLCGTPPDWDEIHTYRYSDEIPGHTYRY